MGYTAPHTIAAGELVTTTTMNNEWGGNVSFLANKPMVRAYNSATQSVSHGTETTLTFNVERFDTDNMHDNVTNTSRITIVTAGVYLLGCCFEYAAAADYNFAYGYYRLNGTTNIGEGSQNDLDTIDAPRLNFTSLWKFIVGDYVEIRTNQNNAGAFPRNVAASSASAGAGCEFWATWIGLG